MQTAAVRRRWWWWELCLLGGSIVHMLALWRSGADLMVTLKDHSCIVQLNLMDRNFKAVTIPPTAWTDARQDEPEQPAADAQPSSSAGSTDESAPPPSYDESVPATPRQPDEAEPPEASSDGSDSASAVPREAVAETMAASLPFLPGDMDAFVKASQSPELAGQMANVVATALKWYNEHDARIKAAATTEELAAVAADIKVDVDHKLLLVNHVDRLRETWREKEAVVKAAGPAVNESLAAPEPATAAATQAAQPAQQAPARPARPPPPPAASAPAAVPVKVAPHRPPPPRVTGEGQGAEAAVRLRGKMLVVSTTGLFIVDTARGSVKAHSHKMKGLFKAQLMARRGQSFVGALSESGRLHVLSVPELASVADLRLHLARGIRCVIRGVWFRAVRREPTTRLRPGPGGGS